MEYKLWFIAILLPPVMFGGIVEKCSRLLSNGIKEYYCCDNHEEVSGTCLECKNGYLSGKGEPCVPCPDGSYGRKCDEKCLCSIYQSSLSGIIFDRSISNLDMCFKLMDLGSSYFGSVDLSQKNVIHNIHVTSNNVSNRIIYEWGSSRCDNVFGCVNSPITKHFSEYNSRHAATTVEYSLYDVTRSDHKDTISGLLKREIVIYSICTGGFAVLIFLSTLLLRQYRRTSLKAKSLHGTTGNNFQEQNVTNSIAGLNVTADSTCETTGGEYETIDESNMIDINVSTDSQNTSIDDGSSNRSGNKDASTGSSSSSVTGGSGYLNPYQPIVFDADIHKYSNTCDMKDNSDSSSSEAGKSVSEYINPYQSMMSFTDNHDYRSCDKQDGFETCVHIPREKEKILYQSTVLENSDTQNSPTNKTQAILELRSSKNEALKTNTDGTQMNAESIDF